MNLNVTQGSPEWIAARRSLITATDIPVLLGIGYKCEADLADEKNGAEQPEPTMRMQLGTELQPFIGREYSNQTKRSVIPWDGLAFSDSLDWAAASPDFEVVGDRRLVEAKRSTSRRRFEDGIPQDIEAQVAWQLGVTGYPVADIAVLLGDDEFRIYEQKADPALFGNLVKVAEDFRRRLAAGGPFSRDIDRIRRDYPRDNGEEMVADADLSEAIRTLIATTAERKRLEETEDTIKQAVMARMGPLTRVVGDGFSVSWKATKDIETTDYRSLATSLLTLVPENEREAIIGIHTNVKPGVRRFLLTTTTED